LDNQGSQHAPKQLATQIRLKAKIRYKPVGLCFWTACNGFLLKSGILLQAVWAMFLDSQKGLNMHQNSLQLFKRKSVAAVLAILWGSPGAQHASKQLATLQAKIRCKLFGLCFGATQGLSMHQNSMPRIFA
jgi:hypothetical protein